MKKTLGFLVAAWLPMLGYGQSVTFNIGLGTLRDATSPLGDPIPNATGLIILVASTADSDFSTPSTSAALGAVGSAFLDDDRILGKWQINGGAGVLSAATTPALDIGQLNPPIPGFTQGDLLKAYWFPTLNLSSTAIPVDTSYGQYRDAVGIDGSAPWVTPGGGSTITLGMLTTDQLGSLPLSDGNASNTVVPEPASYATVLGLLSLTAVAYRKFRRPA